MGGYFSASSVVVKNDHYPHIAFTDYAFHPESHGTCGNLWLA